MIVAAIASALTFFVAHLPESRLRVLLWLDALGMAVFCVVGAAAGLDHGAVVAVTCGVMTAVVGGFIRDMMGAEEAAIMRARSMPLRLSRCAGLRVAAWGGGAGYRGGRRHVAAFALRGAALAFGWRLPVYKAKRGRSREEIGL